MLKEFAKGICIAVAAIASFMLVMFVILTICGGPFGGGVDNATPTPTHIPTQVLNTVSPTSTPSLTPTPNRIVINVVKSGQDMNVVCDVLQVIGDNNMIWVDNDDIARIQVLGSGNTVRYPPGADPKIQDLGDYNDVYQGWL